MEAEFIPFPKVPRLFRDIIITEKLDGTNACVVVGEPHSQCVSINASWMTVAIGPDGMFYPLAAQSRNRMITPDADNYGFAKWVKTNAEELIKLGAGRHFGEWWGNGIQRGYGLKEKRFSLFNVSKWGGTTAVRPACCDVVPTLFSGHFSVNIKDVMGALLDGGSYAAPGFMKPEGIMIYHVAAKQYFKTTFDGDNHKEAA